MAAAEPIDIAEELENPRNGFHLHHSDGPYMVQLYEAEEGTSNGDDDSRLQRTDSEEEHDGYVVMSAESVQVKLESMGVNPGSLYVEDKEALGVDVTCHASEVVERSAIIMHQLNRHRMMVEDLRMALRELKVRIPLGSYSRDVRYLFVDGANVYVRDDREVRLMDVVREEKAFDRRVSGHRPLTVTEGVESNDMMAVDYDTGPETGAMNTCERKVYQDLTSSLLADYTNDRRPFGEQASDYLRFTLQVLRTCRSISGILPKLLQFLYNLCKMKIGKLMEIVLLAVDAIVHNKEICLTVGAVKSSLMEILRFLIEEEFPVRMRRKAVGLLPQEVVRVKEMAAELLLPTLDRLVFDGLTLRHRLVERYISLAGSSHSSIQPLLGALLSLLHLRLDTVPSNLWHFHLPPLLLHVSTVADRPGEHRPLHVAAAAHARLLGLRLIAHAKRQLLADVNLLPTLPLIAALPTAHQLPPVDAAIAQFCRLAAHYAAAFGDAAPLPPGLLSPAVRGPASAESSPGSRRAALRMQDSEAEEEEEEEAGDEPPLLEMMAPALHHNPAAPPSLPCEGRRRDDVFDRTPLRRRIVIGVGRRRKVEETQKEVVSSEFSRTCRRMQCMGKRPGFKAPGQEERKATRDWSERILTFPTL